MNAPESASNDTTNFQVTSLLARVDELARASGVEPMLDDPLPSGELTVLICELDGLPIAFPLDQVQEVTLVAQTTPLPEGPRWIVGLLDLRGEMVPVLDVALRIKRRTSASELSDLIVICQDSGSKVGLLVRGVHGILCLPQTNMPTTLNVHAAPYVRSALPYEDGIALLFSIRRLIASSQIPEPFDTTDAEERRAKRI